MIAYIFAICCGMVIFHLLCWYYDVQSSWLLRKRLKEGFTDNNGEEGRLVPVIEMVRRLLHCMGVILRRPVPANIWHKSRQKLMMAGNPAALSVEELWGWRLVSAALAAGVVLFLAGDMVLAGAAAYLASRLPYFWLSVRAARREALISKSLPPALDLLIVCVEAGMTFDAALAVIVARSSPGPLIEEFHQVLHHMRMGDSRREALQRMADRCRQQDVRSMCVTLIQADQLGTSIRSTLALLAEQIRKKRAHRAEALANQAPVKMLFPLLFFIFPSLLLVLFGPVFLGRTF